MLRDDIVRCVPLPIGEVEIVVRIDGIVFDVEEEFKTGHLRGGPIERVDRSGKVEYSDQLRVVFGRRV
jgi:hypothetical protein